MSVLWNIFPALLSHHRGPFPFNYERVEHESLGDFSLCFGQGAVPKPKLAASHPRLDFSMVTRELFREEKSSFLQLCSVLQCWEGLAIAAFSKS